jgi:hypothetical protein
VFVEDIRVKRPKIWSGDKEVMGLFAVRRYILEYLQNLDKVLADIERTGAIYQGDNSVWYCNRIEIVDFICGDAGRWPQSG